MFCAKCNEKVTFDQKLHKWVHENGKPASHVTNRRTEMNTEQVVEMIDAITEGREFKFNPETAEHRSEMNIHVTSEEFNFEVKLPIGVADAAIIDPRTAREIARALIAWANRKEGNNNEVEAFRLAVNYPHRKSDDV